MKDAKQTLIEGNKQWVDHKQKENPSFFSNLATGQSPEYLWIGCSDSRVPVNHITNTDAGDLFVHRNIANMVVHSDINIMSVLYYSVNALKVPNIVVCGHYGCGGVKGAISGQSLGIMDQWLVHIQEVYEKYESELAGIKDEKALTNKLVELNVKEQVKNLGKSGIVKNAWAAGQALSIHGMVYDLETGKLKDLNITIQNTEDLKKV